jgi:hypothetical protein
MPAAIDPGTVVAGTAAPAGSGGRNGKSRRGLFVRRLHYWAGTILTLNFVLLILTGLLVQHRGYFRLEERTVSRKWLPAGYRPQDPDTEIRADIVVTDLHSGRIFGARGPLVVDLAAAGLLVMIVSGFSVQVICRFWNGRKDDS